MRLRRIALLLSVTLFALAHACRDATQVTLDITTDAECSDLRGVDLIVTADAVRAEELAGSGGRARVSTTSTDSCVDKRIGTLVVTPSGDRAAVVVVAGIGSRRAETCLPPDYGAECIVARRNLAFAPRSARLPIVLTLDCRGVPCDATSTCSHGQCVDAAVDCSDDTCTEPGVLPDGGIAVRDAATSDATTRDVGTPDAPAADGGNDGGNDGGAGDGGFTGMFFCQQAFSCLVTSACGNTPGDTQRCCYETGNTPYCSGGSTGLTCNGPTGCCRSIMDCGPGYECCATSDTPNANMQILCLRPEDCAPNRAVCDAPGMAGECFPGKTCTAIDFGVGPGSGGYKRCQ